MLSFLTRRVVPDAVDFRNAGPVPQSGAGGEPRPVVQLDRYLKFGGAGRADRNSRCSLDGPKRQDGGTTAALDGRRRKLRYGRVRTIIAALDGSRRI